MNITLPPFEDLDENGNYIGNDINFLIKNENRKEDILNSFLKEDSFKLNPSSTLKTELFIITSEEFDLLRKHIGISDFMLNDYLYDTIIIQNKIFKKQK
jgi:hypothetical protein